MTKKSAPQHRVVLDEIAALTVFLVECGLADDQNMPHERSQGAGCVYVQYGSDPLVSAWMKNRPYADGYYEQLIARRYNVRMLDGALIQMLYEFDGAKLVRSRLAFLPSPDLLEFQNNSEIYLQDVLYADVIDRRVVTVPLRFDFDGRDGISKSVYHPKSHLTLGQYRECRIASTAPITPYLFIEFILRSFYNTAIRSISTEIPCGEYRLGLCITDEERALVHIGVPAFGHVSVKHVR